MAEHTTAAHTSRLTELRRLNSADKARRVLAALDATISAGEPLTIAALARRAGVSRRFLYDHPELRAEAERRSAQAADRRAGAITAGAQVTAASLRADLANARAANHRQHTELEALRRRLGQILGRQVLADLGDTTPVTHPTDPRIEQLDTTLSETKKNSHNANKNSPPPARSTANSSPASTGNAADHNPHPTHVNTPTGCRAHLRTTQTRRSQPVPHTPYPRKGHESIETTQIYLHADMTMNRTPDMESVSGR